VAAVVATVAAIAITSATASAGVGRHGQTALTRSQVAQFSRGVNQRVIVVLRHQVAQHHVGSLAAKARASAVDASQDQLLAEVRQVRSTHLERYQLLNAFAATVSTSERAWLASDNQVKEVIPDVTINGALPVKLPSAHSKQRGGKHAAPDPLTPHVIPGACSARAPQLDPEGLSLTGTDSDNPRQPTARSLGFTGTGVPPYGQQATDELTALPYEYRVG
jgi:hypothetical protein